MRRRLEKFLPVVLLALAMQILAPIAACWAAAADASDPLQTVEICHSMPAANSAPSDQSGDHRVHDGACAICCVTQAGASIDTPKYAVFTSPYRRMTRVVWTAGAPALESSRTGSNMQARAPPLPM